MNARSHRLGRILAWILVVVLILAAGAYLAVGAVAANALTLPKRDFAGGATPAELGLAYEDVRFAARHGAAEIAGWYIPGDAEAPVIIMVHGRDASRTAAVGGGFLREAKLLHDGGYGVLMIDLRGHGQSSDARFTFGIKERSDVLGAVDWLLLRGAAPGRIGVLGLSLGAAAAIGAAAEEPAIGVLVLDSGFADINTLIGEQWEKASGLPRPFLYSALLMARLMTGVDLTQAQPARDLAQFAPKPILLIHCAADDYVPPANLESLHAAAPTAQTWVIRGANCLHSEGFNADPAAYGARIQDFFAGVCRYDEIKGIVSCALRWWGDGCTRGELAEPGTEAFVAEAWVDANENGKWDEGEPPLPGARLNISVWGFNPCTSNYFSVDSCSPEGVEIPGGVGESDLWLLMRDRCKWQDGLAAATDSQGRMVIVIDTDAALSYAFTPVAPAGYRAPCSSAAESVMVLFP